MRMSAPSVVCHAPLGVLTADISGVSAMMGSWPGMTSSLGPTSRYHGGGDYQEESVGKDDGCMLCADDLLGRDP